jgi:hypothetical protein
MPKTITVDCTEVPKTIAVNRLKAEVPKTIAVD